MNKNILFLVSLTLLFVSCNTDSKINHSKTNKTTIGSSFNQVLDDYYEEGLKLNPLNATSTGDNRYNNIFPNTLSDEYIAMEKIYYTTYLEKITQFNDKDLSESERISRAILKWECEINLERLTFKGYLFPIDQMWSINLAISQWASGSGAQPFNTVEDYNNWLERLEGYLEWMASAETRMKEGIALGYVLPKSLIVKVIPQLKAFTVEDLEEHLFYDPVKNFPKSLTDDEKKILTEAYTNILIGKIIPAYKRLHKFMSTDYLKAGRESSGIGSIPNGKAYYRHQIKAFTTTDMTADEIYQLGLKEVARILHERDKLIEKIEYTGDMKSFIVYVNSINPFTKPQQIIDNFNAIHSRIKPALGKLFDIKPKTPFKVRRTEEFREASASAEYIAGSLDGTRPGIFYIPIPDATKYVTYWNEVLFLHEAIPGHHYQISLTQENEELPKFRKTFQRFPEKYMGYVEGWALYTESLGKELGLYTDPHQYFGMLDLELWRAIRLVVDIGLHDKDWTREEAIQYTLEQYESAYPEEIVISAVERYMANPGQALSYKIGQLKIRELRSKAERELGSKFDIRQFHNQVLETGGVPLAILEDKINNWIASYK